MEQGVARGGHGSKTGSRVETGCKAGGRVGNTAVTKAGDGPDGGVGGLTGW